MIRLFIVVVFAFFLVSSFSYSQALYGHEMNQFRERVAIPIESKQDIARLVKADIEIDRCSLEEKTVYAYATPEEVKLIEYLGFQATLSPDIIGKNTRENSYHTYEALTAKLKQFAKDYPSIAKLESIGQSVEKRELWILKISDNVEEDEAEPEVKYVSTMHGDEVVGQEMFVYLIQLLLENYGKDAQLTALVNDLEIWIMPNMNPDGTAKKRRYNSQWVDLNRNFPDVQSDINNDPTGRAVETQAMMKFSGSRNFCLSLNFHGGAVVMNYPWDTMAGDPPNVELVRFLCLGYSKRNIPMYKSTSFKDGITNGYDWYEVNSGMQDWNYHWHNCLDLTVEVSQQKWPGADTLPQYWKDNKESLLWSLAQARRGIQGIVKDKVTQKAVEAKIQVSNISKVFTTNKGNGFYNLVLMPGKHTVKFTAPGYEDYILNVLVEDNDVKIYTVNVNMIPQIR
ncbi:MAG: DUF2817 domain-containing protein [Candidatus Brocadiae bacterium]|nr:DUF2817 domain-containing protein [Candidatus Brocadiia bacterium]